MAEQEYDVSILYVGIPHFMAICQECDWSYENHRDRNRGYKLAKKHVSETGHTVAIEKAVVTHYIPERE